MYYAILPIVFMINYIRQLYKWLTKGLYRTFKYAWKDATEQTIVILNSCSTKKVNNSSLTLPRFITTESVPKKRKRRGHRGGRKHRKNKRDTKHGKV